MALGLRTTNQKNKCANRQSSSSAEVTLTVTNQGRCRTTTSHSEAAETRRKGARSSSRSEGLASVATRALRAVGLPLARSTSTLAETRDAYDGTKVTGASVSASGDEVLATRSDQESVNVRLATGANLESVSNVVRNRRRIKLTCSAVMVKLPSARVDNRNG